MELPYCKDCKYWAGIHTGDKEDFISWGQNIAGMEECKNEKLSDERPLITSTYDGPPGDFLTAPYFGCNQFKPK